MLRWSIGAGHRTDNPAGEAISEALPKNGTAVRQHRRTLHHREVAGALAKIRQSGAGTPTKLMLEYTILTATRSGESRLGNLERGGSASRGLDDTGRENEVGA